LNRDFWPLDGSGSHVKYCTLTLINRNALERA
jgi:hypothetical protein